MKRSEMILKICELLEVQSLQGMGYIFKAEQIIQLLENNGMLPPECQPYRVDWSPIKNEWEPENETNE